MRIRRTGRKAGGRSWSGHSGEQSSMKDGHALGRRRILRKVKAPGGRLGCTHPRFRDYHILGPETVNMTLPCRLNRPLFWAPRALSMVFIAFVSMFALDAFS